MYLERYKIVRRQKIGTSITDNLTFLCVENYGWRKSDHIKCGWNKVSYFFVVVNKTLLINKSSKKSQIGVNKLKWDKSRMWWPEDFFCCFFLLSGTKESFLEFDLFFNILWNQNVFFPFRVVFFSSIDSLLFHFKSFACSFFFFVFFCCVLGVQSSLLPTFFLTIIQMVSFFLCFVESLVLQGKSFEIIFSFYLFIFFSMFLLFSVILCVYNLLCLSLIFLVNFTYQGRVCSKWVLNLRQIVWDFVILWFIYLLKVKNCQN